MATITVEVMCPDGHVRRATCEGSPTASRMPAKLGMLIPAVVVRGYAVRVHGDAPVVDGITFKGPVKEGWVFSPREKRHLFGITVERLLDDAHGG